MAIDSNLIKKVPSVLIGKAETKMGDGLMGNLNGVSGQKPWWMGMAMNGQSFSDALNNKAETEKDETMKNGMNMVGDFFSGMAKGGGIKGGLGAAAAAAGDFMAGIGSKHRKYEDDDFTDSQKQVQGMVRQVASMFGPIGKAAAAASGAIDAIGSMTGTNLSNIDKNAAKAAGIKGSQWQNYVNYLPGTSMLVSGVGAGLFGGRRSDSYAVSDLAREMQGGYAGTLEKLETAKALSNKRFFAGDAADKADALMDSARQKDQLLAQLNVTNTTRKQSNYYQDLAHQNMNRYAGENYLGYRVGKKGIKLPSVEEVRAILAKRDINKMQNGGVIGVDTNILPEGSLHARLNHLDETNPDLEDVTRKGIPVMAVEDGGELNQIAEIENNELILRLEVTKQLEELMKDGSDEAMIEAGKLLTEEIIENTQDNTGQITEEVPDGK